MEKHKIDWLNIPGYKGETWNPIIGCSKVSEGCKNCYAEKMAGRLSNIESTNYYNNVTRHENMSGGNEYEDPYQWEFIGWNGKTHFVESAIDKPLHWKKPRMIFVCSMSDLFHETTPYRQITEVINIIAACPQHIFILLTKRPEVMMDYFDKNPPLPLGDLENMWIGVTAENQKEADKRIPILLSIPAAKHFVSIEPMLGPIKFNQIIREEKGRVWVDNYLTGVDVHGHSGWYSDKLDWVIIGGESGHKARPMHPDWVRSIRDQCKETDTPFFFKQWGKWYTRWIDQRNNEPIFKMYESYLQFTQKLWVNKGDCCIDSSGKILKCGGDFKDANYPVAIMSKVGRSKTGSELDDQHHKEFPK